MVNTEALEDAVDAAVPIHTKVIANQDFLHYLVSDQALPPDDDKHHFFLKPKQLSRSSVRYSQFSDLLAFNVRGAKGKRGPKQLASLEYHFQCILLSLSWAIYRRQWVLVALDNHAYSKDPWLKRYGLSHAYTKAVVDYLEDMELITKKRGKLYSSKPTRTRIYPTAKLQLALPFRLLPDFMAKLYATNSPESKLLAFTILTVSRPGEARVADWSEFDLENKLWTIPPGVEFDKNGKKLRENKSRKGKDHSWLIPLTTEAIKILESLPTFPDKKGLVFTSAWGNSVRNNHPIIKKLGYGDLATAHGFRSTFRTWAQEKQGKLKHFTEEACELCLKHLETTATRNAYARNQLIEDRMEILNDYESFIFQQGTVVPINKQRSIN